MAYIIDAMSEEPAYEIAIYVILFSSDHSFYLSKTKKENVKEAYKRHYYRRISKTKKQFELTKKGNTPPPMYILEELNTTERNAFHHVVAWTKYFIEHGYKPLVDEKIVSYANDFNPITKQIYERIHDLALSDVCQPGTDLFPEYGMSAPKKKNQKERIYINVNQSEYEKIHNEAKVHGKSMAGYCRQMIFSKHMLHVDIEVFNMFEVYIAELTKRNLLLKKILITIQNTKRYNPMDLKIIQTLIQENSQQQEKAMEDVLMVIEKLKSET